MVAFCRILLALLLLAVPAVAQPEAPRPVAATSGGPAAPFPDATIEVLLDDPAQKPLAKEMVLATVRGTYTVTIALEELTVPRMPDVDWIQLTPDAWSDEVVDGRQVRVMQRRIAFFPQRAGTVTIRPLRHALTVLGRDGSRSVREILSAPVPLEVAPAPAGAWWLPARAVESSDTWDKPPGALSDAETATRRVTLWVLGATREMLPPQPPMRQPWLITFAAPETRSTELTPAGPLSTVTWEWTFNPRTGEPGVLPEVTIPWFDTATRTPRTVTLAATPIAEAGFGTNTAAAWREGFAGAAFAPLAALAGTLLVLFAAMPGLRLRRRVVFRALRVGPERRALRRAVRERDAAAFRVAAAAVLRRAGVPREASHALLQPVDRTLFGPPPASPVDLRAIAAQVEAARAPTG